MTLSKYIKVNGISLFKIGNKKIGMDTLIFNMESAFKCSMDKRGLCRFGQKGNKKCYALRNEIMYKQTREYRKRQQKYWKNTKCSQIIKDIQQIIKDYPQIQYLRFNESGDMDNATDLIKLENIAESLPDKIIYTYTHNQPLYEVVKDMQHKIPTNLIINGSGFMWTNQYNSIDKVDLKFASNHLICGGNCRYCNFCKTSTSKTIYEEIF